MATSLGTVQVDVKGNIIPLKQSFRQARVESQRTGQQIEKDMRGIKSSMTSLAAAAGVTLGAGLFVQMSRAIVDMGATFDHEMAVVRGVSRATGEEFEALEAIALKMGAETEFTSRQAAEGLRFLSMAGFEARESVAALPGVLDLATAGNLDLGRAADIATNALTAMQLPVEELSRVNDTFVATITRTNTNMEMMADSFRYAAPRAQALGYDIERLSALIGILGNAGIQGSMAGTQLNFAMGRVHKVFEQLGMDGSGKDLIDALKAINAAGWDASKAMEGFGERGGRAALVLRQLIPDIEGLERSIRGADGGARKLADQMRSTFIGKTKELKSAVEALGIELYKVFSDDLIGYVEATTEAIRGLTPVVMEVIKINKELGTSFSVFPQALGDIDLLGTAIRDYRKLMEKFGEGSKEATDEQRGFWETVKGTIGEAADWAMDKRNEIADWQLDKLKEGWDSVVKSFEKTEQPLEVIEEDYGDIEQRIRAAQTAAQNFNEEVKKGGGEGFYEQKTEGIRLTEAELNSLMIKLNELDEVAKVKKIAVGFDIPDFDFVDEDKIDLARQKAQELANYIKQSNREIEEDKKKAAEEELAIQRDLQAATTEGWLETKRVKEEALRVEIDAMNAAAEEEKAIITDLQEARANAVLERTEQAEAALIKETELMNKAIEEEKKAMEALAGSMVETLTDPIGDIVDGTKSAAQAFGDMATSIVNDLAKMIIKQSIYNALLESMKAMGIGGGGGGFLSKLFGFSRGAVFGYQAGGTFTNKIVGGPTKFNIGEMGEAGPEAIMPLVNSGGGYAVKAITPDGKRKNLSITRLPSGDLGVMLNIGGFATGAVFGGGLTQGLKMEPVNNDSSALPKIDVVINNNSNADVDVQQNQEFDRTEILVQIGEDTMEGGPIASAIEKRYGLKPTGRSI